MTVWTSRGHPQANRENTREPATQLCWRAGVVSGRTTNAMEAPLNSKPGLSWDLGNR